MRRWLGAFSLLLIALAGRPTFAAAPAAAPAPPPDPASISDKVLPAGPNRELVVRTCAVCHPIELVVAKPRSVEVWDMLIAKMVDNGAVATEAEQLKILAYLAKYFPPIGTATGPP